MVDALCSWLAHPLARALPDEQPDHQRVVAAVLALTQLLVLRAVAGRCDELPQGVEAALGRLPAERDLDGWVAVWTALVEARWASDALSPELEAAAARLGAPATVSGILTRVRHAEFGEIVDDWLQAYVDVLGSLGRRATAAGELCWVRDVQRGEAAEVVRFRRLVGTARAGLEKLSFPRAPSLPEDAVCFWDSEGPGAALPRWLARWDPTHDELLLFTGRDADGQLCLHGVGRREVRERPGVEQPGFLQGRRLAEGFGEPPAREVTATSRMADERVVVPPSRPPEVDTEEGLLVLRILSTRYVLRYQELVPNVPVVIGRSAQSASWVIRHHQISRAHSRVVFDGRELRVSDCGSTNGTQLNGQDIGRDERIAKVGDVVGAGPLLLRIERLSVAERARIDTILQLTASEDRDPLTRLLTARHLSEHLPAEGTAGELWGIVLYIDKLTAIHAQHGEQVADGAFAVAARVLQSVAPDPLTVTRLGYGEVFVPLVASGEPACRALAQRLSAEVVEHPWEPPLRRLHLVAGIGRREPGDDVGQWVGRIRHAIQAGRRV